MKEGQANRRKNLEEKKRNGLPASGRIKTGPGPFTTKIAFSAASGTRNPNIRNAQREEAVP